MQKSRSLRHSKHKDGAAGRGEALTKLLGAWRRRLPSETHHDAAAWDDVVAARLRMLSVIERKVYEELSDVYYKQRPALAEGGKRRAVSRERLERGHLPLFRDFYEQMTNQPLDEAGAKLVSDTFDRVTQKDR